MGKGAGERLRPALTVARSLPWPEKEGAAHSCPLSQSYRLVSAQVLCISLSPTRIFCPQGFTGTCWSRLPTRVVTQTHLPRRPLWLPLCTTAPRTQLHSRFSSYQLPPAEALGFGCAFGCSEQQHLRVGPLLCLVLLPAFRTAPGT